MMQKKILRLDRLRQVPAQFSWVDQRLVRENFLRHGEPTAWALYLVLVTVADSGPGLSPGSLTRLFQAFHTTKPQGMGMGLAISRSIVEAHGGRLWATANEPRGAVFQFTLPIGREQVA